MFSPDDPVQLKGVAEAGRRPERAQAPRVSLAERAARRWAGIPQRRCWSGLSAISLGYRRRDELSASGAARACAMGGAPVRECGGVDVNTQHDVSIGLESLFHFLGHPQPFFPARWHLVAIVEKLQQRWIIFLLDPKGPDCGRRFILEIRHRCSSCRCCLSLTRSEAGRPPRTAAKFPVRRWRRRHDSSSAIPLRVAL